MIYKSREAKIFQSINSLKKTDFHKQEDFLWLDKDCMETQAAVICQQTSWILIEMKSLMNIHIHFGREKTEHHHNVFMISYRWTKIVITDIPFERLNTFGNLIGATSNVCSLSNCGCVPKSRVSPWQLILSCSSLPIRSLFNLQVGGAPLSEKDTES